MTHNETKHTPPRVLHNGPWPESEGSPLRAAAESATRPELPRELLQLVDALEFGVMTHADALVEAYELGRRAESLNVFTVWL